MNKSEPITEIPYKMHRGIKCIDQLKCNEFWDGEQTFVRGDIHPTIKGLVFASMKHQNSVPYWITPDKVKSENKHRRKYNKANPEITRKAVRKWAKNNAQTIRDNSRKYREANPEKLRANETLKRARQLGADISFEGVDQYTTHDKKMTNVLFAHAKRLTDILGTPFEVDHIQPLSLGGSNRHYNLQVVPKKWNRAKGNRSFAIWGAPFGRSDMHLFDCEILPTK